MGNEENRLHYLREYDQRYNEILVFIAMNKRYTELIFHNSKKHELRAQHGATIIIIIST